MPFGRNRQKRASAVGGRRAPIMKIKKQAGQLLVLLTGEKEKPVRFIRLINNINRFGCLARQNEDDEGEFSSEVAFPTIALVFFPLPTLAGRRSRVIGSLAYLFQFAPESGAFGRSANMSTLERLRKREKATKKRESPNAQGGARPSSKGGGGGRERASERKSSGSSRVVCEALCFFRFSAK